MISSNPGPRRPVAASCRILCSNVRGLSGNLSDLAVASSQYDILLCSETLVSDLRHVSELLVPGFGLPVLLCRGKLPHARGMAAYVRDGYGAFCQPKFECGCCEMQGPDYQNACKVTMFSTLYLELQHESYNVPAML